MATDLFAKPSRNYVYPTIAPCANNTGSELNLEFVNNDGIGIVSGPNIVSKLDFSNLSIPVTGYNNESKLLKPGEITYIPGLTKGLSNRKQGFTLPSLVTTNEELNPYFYTVDLSISYFYNFKNTYVNINASSNYDENINIANSLNISLGLANTKISAYYNIDNLIFIGQQAGYDFTITNIVLNIIDTSTDINSPFPHLENAESYDLVVDDTLNVEYAKYPNGAMQGIVMKGLYPPNTGSCSSGSGSPQNFLLINHTTDFVTIYEPVSVQYDTQVDSGLSIYFDVSTFIGTRPIVTTDVSVYIPDFTLVDTSINIDASVGADCSIYYAQITDSSITDSSIFYSNIISSDISGLIYLEGNYIEYTNIFNGQVINNNIIYSNITLSDVSACNIQDSSIISAYITNSYLKLSTADFIELVDSSVLTSGINDSSIFNSIIEDSSLITDKIDLTLFKNGYIQDSSVQNSKFYGTELSNCIIEDSSILLNTIVSNNSKIYNSLLINAFTNTFKLLTYTDPCTLINYYTYVSENDMVDASTNTVSIYESTIWDSSINNAAIYDSSIYNTFLEDCSLYRCTTYNCRFDPVVYFEDTKDILIDPSINAVYTVIHDTSIFYSQKIKRLDVGMNGMSTDDVISAGDYLNWVTENNYWNKFGDMYIWTSAMDCIDYPECKNLVNGFYVYNTHTFDIKIEYIVFV